MDEDGRLNLPAAAVTLGREKPLRMAVAAPGGAPAALIDPAPRVSATPTYSTRLQFDWRRNEPLAAPAAGAKAAL